MDDRELWLRYEFDRSAENRNALVEFHMPLVKHIANKLTGPHFLSADFAEYVANGYLGLIQAVESYDSSRKCRFATYARHRIRGAMLDAVRSNAKVLSVTQSVEPRLSIMDPPAPIEFEDQLAHFCKQLTGDQEIVFRCVSIEGMSFREASLKINKSPSWAGQLYAKALESYRNYIIHQEQ